MADRRRRCGKPTVDGSPCRNGPGCKVEHPPHSAAGTKALAATPPSGPSSPPLAGEPDGKYGPRTAAVEKIIDRAGRLTEEEARDLGAAYLAVYDTRGDAGVAARAAAAMAATYDWDAGFAAWGADGDAARAAWDAARDAGFAAWGAAWGAAERAVGDAALGATVADLEGQHGLTREHLDTLTGPWRQVIEDVDPLAALESDDDG